MTESLVHRGPDDFGYFQSEDVALGHRRLSIIDLAGGHQPMHSANGRYVIVFNGEIYNYRELREDLVRLGHTFESHSDTEVLLNLFIEFGVQALDRLNGMFAFAIFDRYSRELFMARDRVGIKPLYYLQIGDKLLFSSESKAFFCWRDWQKDLNFDALSSYLSLRYVRGDSTLIRSVKRLPAASYLIHRDGKISIARYWEPPTGEHKRAFESETEALEALSEVLERSVKRRLVSDVPVGAYLSGGLDSSLIVALMTKLGAQSVSTFSVGFDYEHDELREAEQTALLLNCNHHTVQCNAADIELLPHVVRYSDDPLGDAISIPMFKLAAEAKKEVTVILTGEGADEMFSGYLFHKVMWLANIYRNLIPAILRRRVVHPMLKWMSPSILNIAFKYPANLGQRGKLKVLDFHEMLGDGDIESLYLHLISLFDHRELESLYVPEVAAEIGPTVCRNGAETLDSDKYFDKMLGLQFSHWLPDNMLLRQDKMSMASGIEGRVPFLDHELIEFAFSLPRSMHMRRLVGKYCLRQIAKSLLPKETAMRRKMPFYVPMEGYYNDPRFVEMMEDLIGDDAIANRGLFNPFNIRQLRNSIHSGEFIQVKQVFSLMTLELWFRNFLDNPGTPIYKPHA